MPFSTQPGSTAPVYTLAPLGSTSDETTVVQRAQMSLDAGLGGIAIWAFGYETTDLWPMLRAVGAQYGTP